MINTPADVSFEQRPSDNPSLFLFGWDPGNAILAGSENDIINSRRCSIINGKNNEIGGFSRPDGKYNTHIIGSNKIAQKNNILYIACSNGMYIMGGGANIKNSSGGIGVGENASIGGDVKVTGDVISYSSSDKKLKIKRKEIKDSILKINKINPVSFNWNSLQKKYKGKDIGFIAQQVGEIIPSSIRIRSDNYLGLNYNKLIPLLVASVKEKDKRIKFLTKQIKKIKRQENGNWFSNICRFK
jgi:hypothetical protein